MFGVFDDAPARPKKKVFESESIASPEPEKAEEQATSDIDSDSGEDESQDESDKKK